VFGLNDESVDRQIKRQATRWNSGLVKFLCNRYIFYLRVKRISRLSDIADKVECLVDNSGLEMLEYDCECPITHLTSKLYAAIDRLPIKGYLFAVLFL
jgi:hypothetical protein